MLAADGAEFTAAARYPANTIVQAIARAFRWREMLENSTHLTIREIAFAEKINKSDVGRVLRLTLLSQDIVRRYWVDGNRLILRWRF